MVACWLSPCFEFQFVSDDFYCYYKLGNPVIISSMGLFELQSWLPARALVQEALEGRHKVDPSGQIIKLPVAGCPWKEHLAQLEEEQKLGDAIKFCLYEVS